MRLLDRYVLRNFLEPFLICFGGFIAILLIFDLYDNGPDFIAAHTSFKDVGRFYLTQLPAMTLLAMPVGLVLALLFSLSKMSRHNEIISMLTAGRSLYRVIVPLVCVGLVATGICFALNASAAPHAESIKKELLTEITSGKQKAIRRGDLDGYLFRDRLHYRTWFIRKFRPSAQDITGVHIIQQDNTGRILQKWYATRANYDAKSGDWYLTNGKFVEFASNGDISRSDSFVFRTVPHWEETPWRIASSQVGAQNLSIQELREYLRFNSDFPSKFLAPYWTNLYDRYAFPWGCIVLVFIAAPLGIVYNRRGILGGVAAAVFLFIGTILARSFLKALGDGQRLDPLLAAWLPNAAFFVIGLVLLFYRSTNRELPKIVFWR